MLGLGLLLCLLALILCGLSWLGSLFLVIDLGAKLDEIEGGASGGEAPWASKRLGGPRRPPMVWG